ncbi:glycosyltransferase [Aliikangiella coralliicola]|uniref:Glycosyltransferase n=1 Tax=Aliikangiella coralliicola TaxID=2592383 RepID=A0A545UFF3_9GAMM|nr:glycosyltransferase [Aliikangiella coralliicola]TQV88123.1 glycosyltransferase [Aliikangiella coralliicola]
MMTLSYVLLSLHFLMLAILCLFGIHRLSMVVRWIFYRKMTAIKPKAFSTLPRVTVQIPLYNERLVAQRIVDAVAQIDYPHDKLQIQIVDDSTDETSQLVATAVEKYAKQGLDINHVHRVNRKGFKAGALKDAMKSATGDFIAIFDADFIPSPSIIKDTIDHFNNEKLAMIQFRWEHLNRHDSRLTETQAMMLDSHFSLEQQVRYASDVLFNFNGTAGIWRTKAIIDAGHWSADTLTEDLDLSYRAQLKGWELVYLNDVVCPGELPADMNAFKSQQHRWAKGGIQVMKKMLLKVWRSPLSLRHKLESTFHLSNNLAYFVMLVDTIFLLIPSLIIREQYQLEQVLWIDLPLLFLSSGGHLVYFFFGQIALGHSKWRAIKNMPRVLLLGIQLAFNNAKAALEALRGQQSEFVRTPKSGANEVQSVEQNISQDLSFTASVNAKLSQGLYKAVSPRGGGIEGLLGVIYSFVFFWGIKHELWFMLPFLLLLIVGFFSTAISTLKTQHKLSRG